MVSQLFFPGLADRAAKGEAAAPIGSRAVGLILMMSFASVVGLYVVGSSVFLILYGSRYRGADAIAWKIGVAMIPFSLVNFLLFHFLARKEGGFLWPMSLALASEVIALYLGPKSGTGYAVIMSLTGMSLLLMMAPKSSFRRFAALTLRLE
jgi:O-antigen/teichoic acid export membrane protein